MNILHLMWIVPLSASFGFAVAACLAAASDADRDMEGVRKHGDFENP